MVAHGGIGKSPTPGDRPLVRMVTLWDRPPLILSILPGLPPVRPRPRGDSCLGDAVQLPTISGPGRVPPPERQLPHDVRSEGAETSRRRGPARADQAKSPLPAPGETLRARSGNRNARRRFGNPARREGAAVGEPSVLEVWSTGRTRIYRPSIGTAASNVRVRVDDRLCRP